VTVITGDEVSTDNFSGGEIDVIGAETVGDVKVSTGDSVSTGSLKGTDTGAGAA
jgi:hypothetical protein